MIYSKYLSTCTPDLYSLARVAELQPNNLHDLTHGFWVRCVPYTSYSTSQNDKLADKWSINRPIFFFNYTWNPMQRCGEKRENNGKPLRCTQLLVAGVQYRRRTPSRINLQYHTVVRQRGLTGSRQLLWKLALGASMSAAVQLPLWA